MNRQPEALRLADAQDCATDDNCGHCRPCSVAAELRRLHALIVACEPYLKESETPAERIERDHRDSLALMTLLAREKTKNEALLEACKTLVNLPGTKDWVATLLLAVEQARAAIAKAEGEKA